MSGVWRGAALTGAACLTIAACGMLSSKGAQLPEGCAEADFAALAASCAVHERATAAGPERSAVAKACLTEIDTREHTCLDAVGGGGAP